MKGAHSDPPCFYVLTEGCTILRARDGGDEASISYSKEVLQ